MGRRPNAIVSEHFQRGDKLDNSSNRYPYTCRSCGEAFPKGRVDSLISHVTQSCQKIGPNERQHALQSMQQLSSHSPEARRSPSAATHSERKPAVSMTQQGSALSRDPSALDTLAEVSRRHLDFSSHKGGDSVRCSEDAQSDDHMTSDHALIQELRKAANIPESPRPSSAAGSLVECIAPLVQTAAQANERLERGDSKARLQPSFTLDPRLEVRQQAGESNASASQTLGHGSADTLQHESMPDAYFSSNVQHGILLQHVNAGFGSTPKARGRFSDTRRKQVSAIRKRGACIRCRMLKKPCSEGTPCLTCKGVESARLWKTSCVRTRVAEEFALWSVGLFHAKARIDVLAAVQGRKQSQLPGRIEMRVWQSSSTYMVSHPKRYEAELVGYRTTMLEEAQSVDPALQQPLPHSPLSAAEDIILLDDGEILSTKIEQYIRLTTSDCMVLESSSFVRNTLKRAQVLGELEDAHTTPQNAGQTSRSSYSLQDQLLKNVIELWTGTMILASHESIDASIRYSAIESQDVEAGGTGDVAMGGIQSNITGHSKYLITAQLLAATESRCATLAKTVMNEIERRLLQRQQVSRVSTLMSAIILLNCIERMTSLYWSLDPDPASTTQGGKLPPSWPLDTPPHKLWLQGEHFADMLIMLLRMRGLPPKTTTAQSGHVIVVPDQPIRNKSDQGRTTVQAEDQTGITAEWLDSLELKVADLLRIRDQGERDRKAGARAFDLAFISRVLLPPAK